MMKYSPPVHVIVAVWVTCGLGVYGIKAWYFPEPGTWLLVAPTCLIGLVLGARLWRRVRHLYTSRRGRLGGPIFVLLVPVYMSVGIGLGLPALAMRLMGPDSQITATVLRMEDGSRRCRRQIYIAEFWPSRFCVSTREYERLVEGRDVLLDVRRSVSGTFVFSIAPV